MEKKSLLKKIKSKFILNYISEFINGNNIKLNLFKYSKLFQKLLNITIYDYQFAYFKKTDFPLSHYLSYDNNKDDEDDFNDKKFNKDLLKKNLEEYLIEFPQLAASDVNKYILEYYKIQVKNLKEKDEKEINYINFNSNSIDIYSPFFELLSKNEFLDQLLAINLPIYLINKNNLKNDYLNIFDKLEKNNSNYSSLNIIFNDTEELDILDNLKIKFNQIKKVNILANNAIDNCNVALKKLFHFFQHDKNLIFLRMYIPTKTEQKIENDIIEKINNFKMLERLEIKSFSIENPFILKLSNLKYLTMLSCANIGFTEDSLIYLKEIHIENSVINKISKSLLKLPKANYIYLLNTDDNFNSIFDFSSFKNVETLFCNKHDFLKLKNSPIGMVYISPTNNNNISADVEKKTLEKILSTKTLKRVLYGLSSYSYDSLLKIQGENSSIEKLSLIYTNTNEYLINSFISKFPNVDDLILAVFNSEFEREKIYLEIKEDPKSKIKKFELNIRNNNRIKFNCSSYGNLTNVTFNINGEVNNLKDSFPIFNIKNNVIFKSLLSFRFTIPELSLDILEAIYNNIDKMPNLENFTLKCVIKDITEDYYEKLIYKLLKKNLKSIELNIKKEPIESELNYSKEEIMEINDCLEPNNINQIKIHKINSTQSFSQLFNFIVNAFENS